MNLIALYASELSRKILKQEAPGGAAVKLDLVVPTVTQPGKPFDLKVAALDKSGYPSIECEGCLNVFLPDGKKLETGLKFSCGEPAVGTASGLVLEEEGVFRFQAELDGIGAFSNPTLCANGDIPGIFWGDPHVHTILSNCNADKCRSLNFCFTAGRHLSALDWVAAADHVSNGRCDFSKWKEQRTVSNLYNDELGFVTLPGYEASLKGGAGGDNNVYMSRFPEMFVDEYEEGNVATLCAGLEKDPGPGGFFVVPHHTTRPGKHGEIPDEIYPGPECMPLIEIHSKWGTSEYRGNPNALHKIHTGPSYAQDLLDRGMRLGFIAGTDSHATMPSAFGYEPGHIDRLPGITAVFSKQLTRGSVFESLKNRRCYAASLERILLHGKVAGVEFGQEKAFSAELKTDVLVASKSSVTRVELVRNGKTIHAVEPDDWKTRFVFTDQDKPDAFMKDTKYSGRSAYYYLRVTCESGAQAWSSPVTILT